MPIEFSTGQFVSFARHTRRALINLVQSYEENINSVLTEYSENRVAFYLGDKLQPHSPSVVFLSDSDNLSWLATAGPLGGPMKDLRVTVSIIPQIRLTNPEAQEDAIQDFVAVLLAVLEDNLEFYVEVNDGNQVLTWKVWDSLINDGLNISYRYRFGKSFRAALITWTGKIDYLSPLLDNIRTFNSNVSQSDLNV